MELGNLNRVILRAAILKLFIGVPIIRVKIDGFESWFVAFQYKLYNPSNHNHHNELTKCKDITDIIFSPEEYDQDKFLTKLDEKPAIQFSFSNNFDWFMT